jgi:prolyl-tRNA synthetase
LVVIGGPDSDAFSQAMRLAEELDRRGIEALVDDREVSAGEKFADADLLGLPVRLVVSPKTLEEGLIEWKDRATGAVKKLSEAEVLAALKI